MAQTNYKNVEEAKGLEVGDIIENFIALDQHDQEYDLKKQLGDGPVVLLFYRGH